MSREEADLNVFQGVAHKRNGTLSRWVSRFFTLSGSKLIYRARLDSPPSSIRATLDLQPGCVVTQIAEEKTLTGKKLYSFWIIWPPDDDNQGVAEQRREDKDKDDDSDEEGVESIRGLKHIVDAEAVRRRNIKEAALLRIERHMAHDSHVSTSLKMVTLGLGGLLIGILGGIVPVVTVVGLTAIAAAGGASVAIKYRAPANRRLILGLDTLSDCWVWHGRIEAAIAALNRQAKASRSLFPSQVDADIISFLLQAASAMIAGWRWHRVAVCDGMRISSFLYRPDRDECLTFPVIESPRGVCKLAQVVLPRAPVEIFLALMEEFPWGNSMQMVKSINTHTDILRVNLKHVPPPRRGGVYSIFHLGGSGAAVDRQLNLARFWHRDDEGGFLIAFHSTSIETNACAPEAQPAFDAVVTISHPRHQGGDREERPCSRALVVATVQLGPGKEEGSRATSYKKGGHLWLPGEAEVVMRDFLASIVGLRDVVFDNRYKKTDGDGKKLQQEASLGEIPGGQISNATTPSKSKKLKTLVLHGSRGVMNVQPGVPFQGGKLAGGAETNAVSSSPLPTSHQPTVAEDPDKVLPTGGTLGSSSTAHNDQVQLNSNSVSSLPGHWRTTMKMHQPADVGWDTALLLLSSWFIAVLLSSHFHVFFS